MSHVKSQYEKKHFKGKIIVPEENFIACLPYVYCVFNVPGKTLELFFLLPALHVSRVLRHCYPILKSFFLSPIQEVRGRAIKLKVTLIQRKNKLASFLSHSFVCRSFPVNFEETSVFTVFLLRVHLFRYFELAKLLNVFATCVFYF